MQRRFLFTIPLLLLTGDRQYALGRETPARENRMVHRDGGRIMDGSGRPLKLRGVNLGGWLLWEPWMWGGHLLASESRLSSRLQSVVGADVMARFRQEIYDNFITESDIQQIASLGFNVVRVPLNHRIFDRASGGESGWQVLDRLLSWCEKHRVYVVFDLHAAPGGQSRVFTADPEGTLLWDSAQNQLRTIGLWKAIAERYRDNRMVAGYDLLNEPGPPNGRDLAEIYRRIIAAIREVDPSHMIFVEGSSFASDFSMFTEPLSTNQAYSFHMYVVWKDNRKTRLDSYRRLAKMQNIPLWCGEFGQNAYDIIDGTLQIFEKQDNAVEGWAYWTWKRASTQEPGLREIKLPAAWKHLVDRASSPFGLGEPLAAEAIAAMKEFVQAIRAENNVEDPRMKSLLTAAAKN